MFGGGRLNEGVEVGASRLLLLLFHVLRQHLALTLLSSPHFRCWALGTKSTSFFFCSRSEFGRRAEGFRKLLLLGSAPRSTLPGGSHWKRLGKSL